MRNWFRRRADPPEPEPEVRAITFESMPWLAVPASASGITVSPSVALRSPTFLACCRVLSESLGTLPAHVFRKGREGSRERVTDHPAAVLLAGDWSPWAAGVETRVAMVLDVLLHGEAFAQVVRAGTRPRELHRLPHGAVTVEVDETTLEPSYRVRLAGGGERRLSYRDCLHVKLPGSTPDRKLSLVDLCRESIAVELAIERYTGRLFSGGGRPSGILTLPKGTTPERLETIGKIWTAAHGAGEAGKVALLEDGSVFTPLSFNSVDMQTVELKKLAATAICGAAKVPQTLVGILDRAVWRNITELNTQYVQHALLPHLEIWKAALERVLLTPSERGRMYIEFEVADLLRGDLASRFSAYRTAAGTSWLTPNEIRAREDLPPVADGDELVRQAGQGPAGDAAPPPAASNDEGNT